MVSCATVRYQRSFRSDQRWNDYRLCLRSQGGKPWCAMPRPNSLFGRLSETCAQGAAEGEAMGTRDTFSGGGSIMRGRKDGRLGWTSLDPAENRTSLEAKRPGNRAPSRGEIERRAQEAEAKLIRSFISQCATAYAAEKLNAFHPEPPKSLKGRIKSSGGNVAWLAAQPSYQAFFHKAYCRIIGKDIPIGKVWAQTK